MANSIAGHDDSFSDPTGVSEIQGFFSPEISRKETLAFFPLRLKTEKI